VNIEETYNIHKKINCVFKYFKSKYLCNKGIHNYIICPKGRLNYVWKCYCCGKEEVIKSERSNKRNVFN